MAINKSLPNQLSFQEIEDEFGQNPGRSLGRYRTTHPDFGNKDLGDLRDLPLDIGIPTSGEIKFSDFYQKELNVVIDCHTVGFNTFGHDAYTDRFLNGKYDIVGRYRSSITKSQWQGGKRVIIHINKTFGSEGAQVRDDVAFLTGNYNNDINQMGWPTDTTLAVDLGDEGLVGGKGGNGGDTGNEESKGEDGGVGTSGMKIPAGLQDEISGESRIFGGGGGGAGGPGAEQNDWGDRNSASGGGGGGGAGIPAGIDGTSGGVAGGKGGGLNIEPDNEQGGDGGKGGNDSEAEGATGGNGGDRGSAGGGSYSEFDEPHNPSLEHGHRNGGLGGHQYRFY
mgnify:FL=1|tara:strand:+ start:351 stop:1361 length:1011 start_codon:yes stop_codon:yes gene_type:complete